MSTLRTTLLLPKFVLKTRGSDLGAPLVFAFAHGPWIAVTTLTSAALVAAALAANAQGEPALAGAAGILALLSGASALYCIWTRHSLTLDEQRRQLVYRGRLVFRGSVERRHDFRDFDVVELINVRSSTAPFASAPSFTWVLRLSPPGGPSYILGPAGLRGLAFQRPVAELGRELSRRMGLPLMEAPS